MYRSTIEYLKEWKKRSYRKPLVIRGARQVGKTFIVRMLSQEFENYLEINLETDYKITSFFKDTTPEEIIDLLGLHYNKQIQSGKTLLFFDEIQAAPEIFAKLRYFYEKMPELHIIAAGSLLEFLLQEHEFSMPVGRIEYMYLGPMSFSEFLISSGNEKLYEYIKNYSFTNTFHESIHEKLVSLYKKYIIAGGMPESIKTYLESQSFIQSDRVKSNIIATYIDDFNKYRKRINHQLLITIFKALPAHIARKVKYSNISSDSRAAEVASVLNLFYLARICYPVYHSSSHGIPLSAEINTKIFKLLFLDIGLLCSLLGLTMTNVTDIDNISLVNNGVLSEQFIGQHLLYRKDLFYEPELYYWNRESPGSNAEVDFVISHGTKIIPVEVKAGTSGTLKSLHLFVRERNLAAGVRVNLDTPSVTRCSGKLPTGDLYDYKLVSLPCYMVDEVTRLIDMI